MIYFDNAATSLIKPQIVKNSVLESMDIYTANPGRSAHKLSQKVALKIFDIRESVKEFFGAKNYNLIFSKNCTESLNLAIFGFLKSGDNVIATCYEHNSVLRPLERLKSNGIDVTILECEMGNMVSAIEQNLKENTRLVITTFVSNVTGEVCPVGDVSRLCKRKNVCYLVDGAQAAGHMLIDINKLDVDMFAFAGHKGLLGLTGVGGLLIKSGIKLMPLIYGGTGTESENLIQPTNEEEGFESGTIPTIPIISLGAGIEYLKINFQKILKKEQNLSKYLYFSLKNLKFLEIYSKETSKNVFSFNIKGFNSSEVANLLNEKFDICVRSGLHCAPLMHKKLNTLNTGAVRVSLDFNNTYQEIDRLIYALKRIANN